MNHSVIERTATALIIDHLNLKEYHIGTIGLRALRIRNGGELQLIRFSGRVQLVAAAIGTYRFEHARFEGNMFESKEITVLLPTPSQRATVEEQFQ